MYLFWHFGLYAPKTSILFGFPILWSREYLEKVSLPGEGFITWRRFHYLVKASLPCEGFITWWRLHYLVKVSLPGEGFITWWRFHYLVKASIPGEGFITWWRLHYLVKVSLPSEGFITWWRFHYRNVSCTVRKIATILVLRKGRTTQKVSNNKKPRDEHV